MPSTPRGVLMADGPQCERALVVVKPRAAARPSAVPATIAAELRAAAGLVVLRQRRLRLTEDQVDRLWQRDKWLPEHIPIFDQMRQVRVRD